MDSMKWRLIPLKQIGRIKFGMKKNEVHGILGKTHSSFWKSFFSRSLTEDYCNYHVYYDKQNLVEAIEIFNGVEVVLNDKTLFPGTVEQAQKVLSDLKYVSGSYISRKNAIGLYAPNDKGNIEAILVAGKRYYE